ncbi:MAG: hypothetical protein AAGD11_09065 [Planctomycetota bacterium]
MWCDICQQDVPAVARAANEPLCCPRCQHELGSTVAANPSDVGISLDSFDQPATDELAPPVDWLTDAETSERLREIDRTLSRTYRRDLASPVMTGMHDPRSHVPPASYTTTDVPLRSVARNAKSDAAAIRKPNRTSWVLSLLLAAGMVSFCSGVGILIWSSAFDLPGLWQAGLTLTIGAEGMLILSLAWMAIRLWRNGRQVNRQLRGVDRQLAEIEQVTGTLAGERQPSSQQFYHHFSQATSPHMLVANLQGQVDLMSARLASEG